MSPQSRRSRGKAKGVGAFFRRAGWWGTSLLLGAIFFLAGGLISLMNRDFSVALQGFVVAALLTGGSWYIIMQRRG